MKFSHESQYLAEVKILYDTGILLLRSTGFYKTKTVPLYNTFPLLMIKQEILMT